MLPAPSPAPAPTPLLPPHVIMSYLTFKNKKICVTVHSWVTEMFLKKSLNYVLSVLTGCLVLLELGPQPCWEAGGWGTPPGSEPSPPAPKS